MKWKRIRLDWVAHASRDSIDPSSLGEAMVCHYSIPALDVLGGPEVVPASAIESGKQQVRGGEVLLSRLNPRKSRVLQVPTDDKHPMLCSGEFIVLKPHSIDSGFLEYLLRSERTLRYLDGAVQSVTRSHQRIRPEVLTKMWVTVPPLGAQSAIADYLDVETARIDALIAKKRRMIDLLNERFWSRVTALTGFGDEVPLRRVANTIRTGTTPNSDLSWIFDDEGDLNWYTPGDFEDLLGLTRSAKRFRTSAAALAGIPCFSRRSVLVVGIGATAGKIGFSEQSGTSNQQITAISTSERMDSKFLAWQLAPRRRELVATAPFTTLPILNNDLLKSLNVAVAPIGYQRRVAAELDDLEVRRTALLKRMQSQIDLLIEKRQALITAAVTGELDIPGAA